MILPDDVLGLIREYSGPLLRFSGKYKKALMELGLRDWPELRQTLSDSTRSTLECETILRKLQEYILVYQECQVRLKEMNRPMYPRLQSSSRTEHVKYIHLRDKLYRELQVMMLGEDAVLEYERKYCFERYGQIFE
jgi:hypothetical protein